MSSSAPSASASGERLAAVVDRVRTAFGFPAAIAMALGLLAGLGLPALDEASDVDVPLLSFSTQDAARSMLETIAMATVSVAGISFSVTVVAFTLAASQLSPRVLRSFRRDLISQLTLAGFLASFVYCVAVLARLGTLGPDRVPSLSLAVAIVLALGSLALFALFIGHIVSMLQPSSVIASISADARPELERPYPAGAGGEPRLPDRAAADAGARIGSRPGSPVRHPGGAYLTAVRAAEIVELASEADVLVRQRARVGDYLQPDEAVAEVWPAGAGEELAERIAGHFESGRQRSLPQDPGFPIRQLADVALKGLSPGINDPTTASTAIEAITAGLLRFARAERPSEIRVDGDGVPRFLADAPTLDDLIDLGFGQAIAFADPDPAIGELLRQRLRTLREAAIASAASHDAADRLIGQAEALAGGR